MSVTHVLTVEASVDGQLDLSSELAAESTDFDFTAAASAVGGDDLLTLIYTSGTTGPPKGVELTHAGMLAQLRGIHEYLPSTAVAGRSVSCRPPMSPIAGPALLCAVHLREHLDVRGRHGRRPGCAGIGSADRLRRGTRVWGSSKPVRRAPIRETSRRMRPPTTGWLPQSGSAWASIKSSGRSPVLPRLLLR